MLVLKRREGDWLQIQHRSGDTMFICVTGIGEERDGRPCVEMGFDDNPQNFRISRREAPMKVKK